MGFLLFSLRLGHGERRRGLELFSLRKFLPLQRESGALPRRTSGGRLSPSALPRFLLVRWQFTPKRRVGGLKKTIPPLKFAIPPPGTPGSPESV